MWFFKLRTLPNAQIWDFGQDPRLAGLWASKLRRFWIFNRKNMKKYKKNIKLLLKTVKSYDFWSSKLPQTRILAKVSDLSFQLPLKLKNHMIFQFSIAVLYIFYIFFIFVLYFFIFFIFCLRGVHIFQKLAFCKDPMSSSVWKWWKHIVFSHFSFWFSTNRSCDRPSRPELDVSE